MTLLKDLSANEVIDVVALLIRLKYSQELIYKFLKAARNQLKNQHIVAQYLNLVNKLKSYEKDLNIHKELNELESCFQELFICSNEDYVFWKNNIIELVAELKEFIPNDNVYEMTQAKKKIKSQMGEK